MAAELRLTKTHYIINLIIDFINPDRPIYPVRQAVSAAGAYSYLTLPLAEHIMSLTPNDIRCFQNVIEL